MDPFKGGNTFFCSTQKNVHTNASAMTQMFVPKPSRYHYYSDKLRTTAPGQWQRRVELGERGRSTLSCRSPLPGAAGQIILMWQ